MKKKLLLTAVFFLAIIANAQEEKRIKVNDFVHKSSSTYEYPTDPEG